MTTKTTGYGFVTVATYEEYEGQPIKLIWFRIARSGATPHEEFFPLLDQVKQDTGHGTKVVPVEFMTRHGWEARAYRPGEDSFAPKVSDGWLQRSGWKKGGIDALVTKVPPFRPGFHYETNYSRTREIVFLESPEAHQAAVLDGLSVTYFADLGDGIHELDYCWGDQPAGAYILIKDGKRVDYVQGASDRTPLLNKNRQECIREGRLYVTCEADMDLERQQEAQSSFITAAKQLELWHEYQSIMNQKTRSAADDRIIDELERAIAARVIRVDADKRAEQDESGILKRLLKAYRKPENPLPRLRIEKGGTWTYHRKPPIISSLPSGTKVFHGDNWWVTWTK